MIVVAMNTNVDQHFDFHSDELIDNEGSGKETCRSMDMNNDCQASIENQNIMSQRTSFISHAWITIDLNMTDLTEIDVYSIEKKRDK